MFERFTQEARRAVEGAVTTAREATAGEVRPEHLLCAVLDDEDCLAVRMLADAGAPSGRVREELDLRRLQYVDGLDAEDAEALQVLGIDLDEVVRRIDRNLGGAVPGRRAPRLAKESKKVLELALREATALRHGYIGSEHLLLGLVRSGDRVVLDTLMAVGVEPAELRERAAQGARRTG